MCEVAAALAAGRGRLARQDEGDNQAVKRKRFSEDENQDHDDVELGVLARRAHTRITNNADADAGGEPAETVGETGREVRKSQEVRVVLLHDLAGHDDCGQQPREREDPAMRRKSESRVSS
eukprot:TRINITY_DN169_c0_g1_i4.p1 TRINITY_DN169_c0_g1~~TRINITY_DN169_c0_g1_i4.p1  ORF type:complete len:121 (+),score=1.98 TRINITY_DN169_c0_g1_i4:366-728(+)